MFERLPPLISGCCLLVYWGTVVRKGIRFSRKERHGVHLIPRERSGQWLRVFWIPTIVAWCVEPWIVSGKHFHSAYDLAWTVAGFIGAAVCVSATIATFSCWREMGRSWRLGIDPEERTQLIFSGPFRIVRHPIYTLSILLVLGTLATTPTRMMLVIVIVHIACLQFEARREEIHLLGKHGDIYADYMKHVGRFLPRISSFAIGESSSR
jgi:protein-S-isoprenylcysteine O-methyltransferase Ste14